VLEHCTANDAGQWRVTMKKVVEALSVSFGISSICFGLLGAMPPGAAHALGIGFGIISICLALLCLGSSIWPHV